MENKELIEAIVSEVLKRLEISKTTAEKESNKEKIILMDDLKLNFSDELQKKYELVYFSEIKNEIKFDDIKGIIISKLTSKLLVELSELIQLNSRSEFIMKTLLEGKKIYVLIDGVNYYQYQNTSPKIIYNQLLEAEDKLKNFGIEFINFVELERKLMQGDNYNSDKLNSLKVVNNNENAENNENEYFLLDKKLINYSIIKKLYEKDYLKIEIKKSSIVTALARDFIKDKNIKIKS